MPSTTSGTEYVTPHRGLHAEAGAVAGDRPDRNANPVIKVEGLAWLEFEKPDLDRAEMFAHDFGLSVVTRTPDELHLRGTRAGSTCLVVRRGRQSRYLGAAFRASDAHDLDRLASATGSVVSATEGVMGGRRVSLVDPSGLQVSVVHGMAELPELAQQSRLRWNYGPRPERVNATQRPPREPARVERLGHIAIATRVFSAALDWYLSTFGLIVSDYLYLDGQRERGPVMAFTRCDRGTVPSDHHTLAMLLAPQSGYVHSAYEVTDLDALAAGGEYLRERGYSRSWGIGRHIQGSQVFDYWRDPERIMVEHYADGDVFDASLEAGWTPLAASGLAQWGPPATKDFLGNSPSPSLVRSAVDALREDNEIDLARLTGLMKAMNR